jgi:hypothetical protein
VKKRPRGELFHAGHSMTGWLKPRNGNRRQRGQWLRFCPAPQRPFPLVFRRM